MQQNNRPFGRSFDDCNFGPADDDLQEHMRKGLLYEPTSMPPNGRHQIDAQKIRFLALGGDGTLPVHESGVRISGVDVLGALDLSGTEETLPIFLHNCTFKDPINLRGAKLKTFSLEGSTVPGIDARGANFDGYLILIRGFRSDGRVDLVNAHVEGDFGCVEGTFVNPNGKAIFADRLTVNGSIYLSCGFRAEGAVRLLGARIKNDLVCCGGTFEIARSHQETEKRLGVDKGAAAVLSLPEARIGGRLYLGKGPKSNNKPQFVCDKSAIFRGTVNLLGARTNVFIDDVTSWPQECEVTDATGTSKLKSFLLLDGFKYNGLAEGAPADAATRIEWLRRQPPNASSPQPFEQLASVLTAMGHDKDARKIRIAKQAHLNRHQRQLLLAPLAELSRHSMWSEEAVWLGNRARWPIHWIIDKFVHKVFGYRHRPTGAVILLAIFFFLGIPLYDAAWHAGAFAPRDSNFLLATSMSSCHGSPDDTWKKCQANGMLDEYSRFNSWAYSLDLILGPIELNQDSKWQILPKEVAFTLVPGSPKLTVPAWLLPWLRRLQSLVGWFGLGFLVAYFTGVIRKT